jgi:hypothetical protein
VIANPRSVVQPIRIVGAILVAQAVGIEAALGATADRAGRGRGHPGSNAVGIGIARAGAAGVLTGSGVASRHVTDFANEGHGVVGLFVVVDGAARASAGRTVGES